MATFYSTSFSFKKILKPLVWSRNILWIRTGAFLYIYGEALLDQQERKSWWKNVVSFLLSFPGGKLFHLSEFESEITNN